MMNDENIKEILKQLEWYRKIGKKDVYYPECVLPNKKAFILLDYITNLQQENERLKGIAHKMHLWIFLNSGNEQKVYDELGLTDEENTMLGYSGQIRIGGGDNE